MKLFTVVLMPKNTATNYPILFTRTPYALQEIATESLWGLLNERFNIVIQHVRGRYESEGTFVHMRPFKPDKGSKETDESSDTWDTIEWLVKNVPNHNARVGMFGSSYQGFLCSMGMIDSHPALQAASPQSPIADKFMGDDLHHNGAFLLAQSFPFHYGFNQPTADLVHDRGRQFDFQTRDGYDFFLHLGPLRNTEKLLDVPAWKDFLAHPNYDSFWQTRNIRPHLRNIRCPVLIVGGWFDAQDLYGTLETYRWTERQNPGIRNTLVMGPWSHNLWNHGTGERLADVTFGAKTGDWFREQVELPFFRHHLKGDTNDTPTEALMFETGANQWRRFDIWPPKTVQARNLFLHASGRLAFTAPAKAATEFDEYPSDPAKPVPFTKLITTDRDPVAAATEDQRFVATRPDVLVYKTEPLTDELTIAGPIKVSLNVSTTGTDADWVVKVIDVYPDDFPDPNPNPRRVVMGGYQQLLRGDVMRSRFRNSFEKPEPMKPGRITRIEFSMQDVFHTFRRGHRLMVQVQSSWFPLVDRNPQTFVPNIAYAKPEDFRKATHRVYHSASAPSSLTVGVLPAVR